VAEFGAGDTSRIRGSSRMLRVSFRAGLRFIESVTLISMVSVLWLFRWAAGIVKVPTLLLYSAVAVLAV
jgi:hypothetical protein